MHSIAECPLRSFCCIITAAHHPFRILNLDNAALDLFLTSSFSFTSHGESLHDLEHLAAARLRTKALRYLQGRCIADILLPDPDSTLAFSAPGTTSDAHNGTSCSAIQSFVIAEKALLECNGDGDNSSSKRRYHARAARGTRRLHGCIHFDSLLPTPVAAQLSCDPVEQRLPLQQQQQTPLSDLDQRDQPTDRRVYVLKDVTEMYNLVLDPVWTNWATPLRQRPSSTTLPPPASFMTQLAPSSSTSSISPADRASSPGGCVTHQKLYSTAHDADWSMATVGASQLRPESSASSMSSAYPKSNASSSSSSSSTSSTSSLVYSSPSSSSSSSTSNGEDPGVLLLHVTRFGMVDHAFVVPRHPIQHQQQHRYHQQYREHNKRQQRSGIFSQNDASISAMTNTSVMSYVHPDDIRILCRGLDRVCKSLQTSFCVRWRVNQAPQSHRRHQLSINNNEQCQGGTTECSVGQGGRSRIIEFQGESFEEWVDPTAVPDPIWESQTREEDPNGISSDNSSGDKPLDGVVWVEVRGSQSSGQPMLAIRPLTTLETQILLDQGFNSSNLITPSRRSRQEVDLSVAVERQSNSKEWRTRTKCMGLEEGMKLPKQLNISALTSCPMSLSIPTRIHLNSQEDANRLKMPGSLPSTLTTTSAINCRQARSSNGDGVMSIPSMLAYPITTPIKPWALFMTIALDAWKQWIQTVHAGQAQFQDWREYVLETMIDQLIEGVCLGLTLLGLEDVPQDIRLEYESMSIATKQQAIKMESAGEDDSEHDHVDQERPVQFRTDCSLQQRKPSGIRRVAVILHHYPTVEGVVVRFGNSWLGQKIKNRLDNKLDTAAAHIVDWWYGSGNEDSAVATHGAKDGLHAVNNSVTIGDGISAETDVGLVDA